MCLEVTLTKEIEKRELRNGGVSCELRSNGWIFEARSSLDDPSPHLEQLTSEK